MKIQGIDFDRQVSQGDVTFTRVDLSDAPARLVEEWRTAKTVEAQRDARGRLIVAHSETGHHHSVGAADARLLECAGGLVCYLSVGEVYADVEHERPFDTHEAIRFIEGVWRSDRQEENGPQGWRPVAD